MSTGWVTKAAAALDRQRVCRPGKQPGKILLMSFHAFAWSVAVLERMGAVNGRSCEQSKLKISLLLARSIYPVLCFGPPVTYHSGPLIQKDNQHDLCTGNL